MGKAKLSRPAQSEDELIAKLEIEILPLSEVEPHPENPRNYPTTKIQYGGVT